MEGSSRKKPRVKHTANAQPWVRKKRDTPSTQTIDPASRIDLSRLFATAEEMNRFSNRFMRRPLIAPHYMDCDEMRNLGFKFQELIVYQGLEQFVSLKCRYYDTLVQAFYSNMTIDDGVLVSTVGKKRMVITSDVWESVIGLKHEGTSLSSNSREFVDFDKTSALMGMLRDPSHIPVASKLTAGKFQVEYRLLHYAIARIIDARSTNFARLGDEDILLLWALDNRKQINWPQFFIERMQKYAGLNASALPYACLITCFIKHFRAHTPCDSTLPITASHSFSQLTIARMDIVKENGIWVHKKTPTAESAPPQYHDDPMGSDSMEADVGHPAGPSASATAPEWFTSAMTNLKIELIQHMDARFDEFRSEVDTRLRAIESHFEPPSDDHP